MNEFELLRRPFNPSDISWRVGATSGSDEEKKGVALAYIDARDVMRRLDEVLTPARWQCRYPWSDTKRLVCEIGVYTDTTAWIWKSNGAGDTDVEAEKGAFSDAFKRAAVLWGIGQYLYDLPNTWVKLEKRGKSWVIPKDQQIDLTKRLGAWQEKYYGK